MRAMGSRVLERTTEREAKLIRLGQLQDALLRDARFVVGDPHAHRRWRSADDSERRKISSSRKATRRGRSRKWKPSGVRRTRLYLYYTLGKLEIMKLREDVQKKEGAAFNLQQFHDDFHAAGICADQGYPQGDAA